MSKGENYNEIQDFIQQPGGGCKWRWLLGCHCRQMDVPISIGMGLSMSRIWPSSAATTDFPGINPVEAFLVVGILGDTHHLLNTNLENNMSTPVLDCFPKGKLCSTRHGLLFTKTDYNYTVPLGVFRDG